MHEPSLFDPEPPQPRRGPERPAPSDLRIDANLDPTFLADSARFPEDEPIPGRESAVQRAILMLYAGEHRRALETLDDVPPGPNVDATEHAVHAWALAGLGRIPEAKERLLRAELHAPRSLWVVEPLIDEARACLARTARRLGQASRNRQRTHRAPRAAATRRRVSTAKTEPKGQEAPLLSTPEVPLRFSLTRRTLPVDASDAADTAGIDPATALGDYRLRAVAVEVDQLRRYDTLLSLGVAHGVDHYEYQLRTVRRVLRDFHGRALLADEVGLGKTIEACLCLEEYLQRGLARRALLLVPPGLLRQWQGELLGKFGRKARIVDGALARRDPGVWRREDLVLASTALARGDPHAGRIAEAGFDMVIVDEAHRLKNRRTLLWKLVERVRARYLLMLSATPVENDLLEIYNVLSLLRPGLFSTQAEFKRRFMIRGKRTPQDPAALRTLLRQVMIRNTRAMSEARLPPRFATTLRAAPSEEEAAFRTRLDTAVRVGIADGTLTLRRAGEVLRAVGARPPAAAGIIERHLSAPLADEARRLGTLAKDAVLADLLARRPDDKVIVFATHRATVTHLVEVVSAAGRIPVVFHGSLSAAEKAGAVETFRTSADVLVATDSGGEGFNLHFARTVVNYDLPWNPMRIEQRIGRVHRIGQEREVFVFNLVATGTIEEEILRVLDEKIDMFELVVGEVEAILGRLGDDEREFSDLVLDIYAETSTPEEMRARFDTLAERMVEARKQHVRIVALEDEVFGRELEA